MNRKEQEENSIHFDMFDSAKNHIQDLNNIITIQHIFNRLDKEGTVSIENSKINFACISFLLADLRQYLSEKHAIEIEVLEERKRGLNE